MEFLKVETIIPFSETSPFLLSWLRGGREMELLLLKKSGERVSIYLGRGCNDLLQRAGWKSSGSIDFDGKGRRIFVKGDSRFIRFGNENYADRIVELLNEEDSGFLEMSIKPHYFKGVQQDSPMNREVPIDRKSKERKGWKVVLKYGNNNLGDYLCHIFSSPKVTSRKGTIGFTSPVIAWWEIHQFIPTTTHSLGIGEVRVGATVNRGDVFIDTRRNPHTMIVGSTGAGKSSMGVGMMNYILKNGVGKVILIDPHGDTAKEMENSIYKKFVISPDSANSINIIGAGREKGITYKVAEDFVSILRSSREVQYEDPFVGPRMEDIISRGISLLANIPGMTLFDFYSVIRDGGTREEIARTCENSEVKRFLEELGGMSREEKASTERAIGRLVNDPMIRTLICNPEDGGILESALKENDLLVLDFERSSFGYEDSRLLSNIFALYVWFAITSSRSDNFFLFLEEGQDYQSRLIADMLSSGRKFGLRVFFLTTSFKMISEKIDSMMISNVSNFVFMKLGDQDKIRVRELIGADTYLPNDSFDFLLTTPSGKERGRVEPINFSKLKREFTVRNYDFITERKKRNLSSEIDAIISEMKATESTYFIFEEFCQVLKEYDKGDVITQLKEKISREKDIHFVGRITLNVGNLKGRHECFQVTGTKGSNSKLPSEFKVTSDLISLQLEKK